MVLPSTRCGRRGRIVTLAFSQDFSGAHGTEKHAQWGYSDGAAGRKQWHAGDVSFAYPSQACVSQAAHRRIQGARV